MLAARYKARHHFMTAVLRVVRATRTLVPAAQHKSPNRVQLHRVAQPHEEADRDALAEDWRVVGDDLRHATKAYYRELDRRDKVKVERAVREHTSSQLNLF